MRVFCIFIFFVYFYVFYAYYNNKMDQNRILELLDLANNTSDTEDPIEESDEEIEDQIEENSEPSDSEIDISENDEEEMDTSMHPRSKFYIGKDKKTKWIREKPPNNTRTRGHNIVTHMSGCRPTAKNKSDITEYFFLFFDDVILRMITACTNIKIECVAKNFSRKRDALPTTECEIKCLLGLLILAGVNRSGRQSLEDLWNQSGFGVEIFHVSMSLQRFRFLLRCIRFDDVRNRSERQAIDRLAPIREVFELFVQNCIKCFSPSEYVTIDEQLIKFRGRCPFRVYLPNKPAKYGLKIFALVDSKMRYTYNMEVYCAKQPEGPFQISNSPSDVVKRLMSTLMNSGRNLTTDNWYTSIPLANDLLKEKITLVGTLRKNKREIPNEFLPQTAKKREVNSSIFGFQNDLTLVSYKPKPNKIVLLLSSMHHDAAIDESTQEAKKPEIITFYNRNKGAVDTVDEMCGSYDVGRNNRRWPLTIFFHLINTAGKLFY